MHDNVDELLVQRRRGSRGGPGIAFVVAVLLHAGVFAGAVLSERPAPAAPLEFVAVRVVPLQALGSPRPARSAPAPRPPAPVPPVPEPAPPEASSPEPKKPSEPEPKKPEPRPAEPARKPSGRPGPETEAASGEERAGSPLGSARGTSPFGATRLEGIDPDFTYDYYLEQMLALIHAEWMRPPTEGEVRAVLSFTVERSGEINGLELTESSGFNAFDLAALRAVANAGPLPPLPASYRKGALRVTLIVR